MRLFSSTKILVTALFCFSPQWRHMRSQRADQAAATATAAPADQAQSGDDAKADAHDDHGKKSFPLGAVSFAFIVLGIIMAPAYHRLNVGGDFTGSISSKEESSGH